MTTLAYEAPIASVDGSTTTLSQFSDRALLIVNVASRCGLTPQYAQLEELHRKFGQRGFSVVGFPCNQFGSQEPGSNEEIAAFCTATYGTTFPIFGKIDVNGADRHEVYGNLAETVDSGGASGDIQWNFEKFLIAPGGEIVARFRSGTTPDDPAVVSAIEAVLLS